jgi:hypothetical protein
MTIGDGVEGVKRKVKLILREGETWGFAGENEGKRVAKKTTSERKNRFLAGFLTGR